MNPDIELPEEVTRRLQRGEVLSPFCPSRQILQHVTSRWGVLILLVLLQGKQRFSELRRRIGGISEKMLTQTLRALEQDGFVLREVFDSMPPHVEYQLTPLGLELAPRVAALADWIEVNLPQILAQQPTEVDRAC